MVIVMFIRKDLKDVSYGVSNEEYIFFRKGSTSLYQAEPSLISGIYLHFPLAILQPNIYKNSINTQY